MSDASSPCITETQYPQAICPAHAASHHSYSVSTSSAPQHHTAHQLCRAALIQHSEITGYRQYATAERASSRRRATGHVASHSLLPATPKPSLFPTPHEVLESVTSQQEAGSEIDGEPGSIVLVRKDWFHNGPEGKEIGMSGMLNHKQKTS